MRLFQYWLAICGLLLSSCALATGSRFGLAGKTKYQVFDAAGEVYVEQEDRFRMIVDNCNWYIKQVPTRYTRQGVVQQPLESFIASSDSTNFYELYSIRRKDADQGQPGRDDRGRIGPGSAPFCLTDPKLILLWYAFGSSCYFDRTRDGYLVPPTVLMNEKEYAKDFRFLSRICGSGDGAFTLQAPCLRPKTALKCMGTCGDHSSAPRRMTPQAMVQSEKLIVHSGPRAVVPVCRVTGAGRQPCLEAILTHEFCYTAGFPSISEIHSQG